MPANLSLILNLILLVAVIVAISRLMKTRRQDFIPEKQPQPSLGPVDSRGVDDIIAVRKLTDSLEDDDFCLPEYDEASEPLRSSTDASRVHVRTVKEQSSSHFTEGAADDEIVPQMQAETRAAVPEHNPADKMVVMFLLAKDQRQFAGYELLQTVLAAGLRFGEGNLFHRHHLPNGQGPVIFSLASATENGTFDLQNIGAFNARGLCLFMETSGNATIDTDRFNILYETARQLSEGLDAHLLDEKRRPLTKESLACYQRVLNGGIEPDLSASA